MQLNPTEQFTISRQLTDSSDTDTNYVRATVRNAQTDAILKIVNLTNKGNRRFTGNYEVPADVSGEGFWITITTAVFTDSGYSTYNPNYAEEQQTYLVQVRPTKIGGGSGTDVDYKKVEKIFRGVVDEIKPQTINVEKPDLSEIEQWVTAIFRAIVSVPEEIKKDLPEKTNLTPISEALQAISRMISRIPTERGNLDLKPVLKAISDVQVAISRQGADSIEQHVQTHSLEFDIIDAIEGLKEKEEVAEEPRKAKKITAKDLLEPIESPFVPKRKKQ